MNNEIELHLNLLGFKVKDQVTGFKGVVSSISFDLYGYTKAFVTPKTKLDGTAGESRWFDVSRLKVTSNKRVMQVPDYAQGYIAEGLKGAAEKPAQE